MPALSPLSLGGKIDKGPITLAMLEDDKDLDLLLLSLHRLDFPGEKSGGDKT